MMQRARDEAVAKLKQFADRDGLTGIANRRYFDMRLADEFSRWQRYGGELSLLLFDLDHFKRINDEFGHLVGDTVLRVMAERVPVTASVGVSTAKSDVTSSLEALINEADAALYKAKREGRNRAVGFA